MPIPLISNKPLNSFRRRGRLVGLASAKKIKSAALIGAVNRPPKVAPGKAVTSKLIFLPVVFVFNCRNVVQFEQKFETLSFRLIRFTKNVPLKSG